MSAVVVISPADLVKIVRDAVREALDARGISSPDGGWVPLAKCGLPPTTLKALVKSGKVRGRKVGRANYVSAADVQRFMSEKPAEPAESNVVDLPVDRFERACALAEAEKVAARKAGGAR